MHTKFEALIAKEREDKNSRVNEAKEREILYAHDERRDRVGNVALGTDPWVNAQATTVERNNRIISSSRREIMDKSFASL